MGGMWQVAGDSCRSLSQGQRQKACCQNSECTQGRVCLPLPSVFAGLRVDPKESPKLGKLSTAELHPIFACFETSF